MAPVRLLDLTRLVSRLGRGPLTGVDRVELAYLTGLLQRESDLFALVGTAAGYLLLDRTGAQGVAALAAGAPLGTTDLLSRLTNWRTPVRGQAEATVRRLAVARSTRRGLSRLLRRVPQGGSYLNVGHSGLTDIALATLHAQFRVAVLIHDTIPLDHPAFSRPAAVTRFAQKLKAVSAHADLVIHSTEDARHRTESHMNKAGRVPDGVVASLGVPQPNPTHLPSGLALAPRYFITLGTIEPRKNHALLLRVWEELARHAPPPQLLVVGARGWADPQLFDQLAATAGVTVLSGLPDGEVFALLKGAAALLFPSLAEGFGLPPVEAAALGTPVVATDLPVLREVLGDYAIYLSPADSYSWVETIKRLVLEKGTGHKQTPFNPVSWEHHFNTVLNVV